jgi:gamma-glutamyltranspeptidase/glutathione hydrolase
MAEAKRFPSGCVASPQYLASAAGLAVLADGGNALDAAIATSLTLGVVAPYMCGYGGDIFAIVRLGDGSLHAYNGSGRSAASATVDSVTAALGSSQMPARGPHSITVPGAVEGWFTLLARFGTRSFADLAQTPLRYARDGFPLSSAIRRNLQAIDTVARTSGDWAQEWRRIYAEGPAVLRQPDLAKTIRTLIDDGPRAYYGGEIGDAIAETVQRYGAFITSEDMAAHTGDWVEPLRTSYRGVEILELPPNSQGLAALEALNIVEEMDLGDPESAQRHHVLIEAMKLALADRDEHVTDIDHMRISPDELTSKSWAAGRRAEIDVERASQPAAGRAAVGGTIYLCAADRDGMLVSLIQSNFSGFGSGVTVPGWGINLQNRGAYFSLDADHVNAIAPSKRTMHTLMPAMAYRDGEPWLVFGTMGGDGQAQTHLQFLTRVIDDELDIQEAIDAPRWVVSPNDWSVRAESRFDRNMLLELSGRGHHVTTAGPFDTGMGHAHAIEVTDYGYAAATDPRAEGAALGL